jgi:hypothetical protein
LNARPNSHEFSYVMRQLRHVSAASYGYDFFRLRHVSVALTEVLRLGDEFAEVEYHSTDRRPRSDFRDVDVGWSFRFSDRHDL